MNYKRILSIVVFVVLVGCFRQVPQIHFVLPVGYSGLISFHIDPIRGVPVVVKEGVCVFRVPRDGELILQNDELFVLPHTVVVTDETGRRLAQEYDVGVTADTKALRSIGMWGGSNLPNRVHEYLFGSESDVEQARSRPH